MKWGFTCVICLLNLYIGMCSMAFSITSVASTLDAFFLTATPSTNKNAGVRRYKSYFIVKHKC